MTDLFKKNKRADRVLFDLPIDYLSFARWYALKQITT